MRDKGTIYQVRARYAEVDKMGVVYHSRYFEWFEAARTEMLRNLGLPYKQLEKDGISLPVVEAQCRYRRPVFYDELMLIDTRMVQVSRSKLQLVYEVRHHDDQVLRAEGSTIHCYMGREGQAIRAPKALYQFFMDILLKNESELENKR